MALKQLMAMLPITVGMGLLEGADAKEISEHGKDIDEEGNGSLQVFVFILLLVLAMGFVLGSRVASYRARLAAACLEEQHAEKQAQLEKQLEEAKAEKQKKWNELYQVAKWKLHQHTADELKRACGDMNFQCGCGATKEAMVRGLIVEHGFDLQSLSREGGGLLGAMASGDEAGSHVLHQPACRLEHVGRSRAPANANERRRIARGGVERAQRYQG